MATIREYIERIECLEQEKKDIASDIKEVYLEAKSNGFNKKAIKQVIKYRKMDPDERRDLMIDIDNYLEEN
jgi:uncharacterized protein (UPF0335 family)